jgi:hypothetical protein
MRNSTLALIAAAVAINAAFVLAESAAGLQWTAPPGWKSEAPRPMRAATYTVPPAAGDRDPAECGVYFFGAGQGGSVDANIERWKSQFTDPNGRTTPARVATRQIHGLKVTTIDTSGEYSGMGGPMAASQQTLPGYRLLGAVVEGPGGNIFVKFTGPIRTIGANQQKYEQLLNSFQPGK